MGIRKRGLASVLLALLLAGCGGSSGDGPAKPPPFPAADYLATARTLLEVGLPEQALTLCREISQKAPETQQALDARLLSADSYFALHDSQKAVSTLEALAAASPALAPEARLRLADFHLRLWNWTEAQKVLADLGRTESLSAPARERLKEVQAKIAPLLSLQESVRQTFRRAGQAHKAVFQKGGTPPANLWIPSEPIYLHYGDKALEITVRKPEGFGFHPLAWRGETFRLSVMFKIESVHLRDLEVALSIGVMNQSSLQGCPIPEEQDSLSIDLLSHQVFQDVERDMPIQLARNQATAKGVYHRRHVAYRYLALDQWFRAELLYSRELARARLRVFRITAQGDMLIESGVLDQLPPFRADIPYALGFQSKPVSPETVMKVHLRNLLFEAAPSNHNPDWGGLKGKMKGFAALSLGLYDEAADLLEPEIAQDPSGVLRLYYRHALLRSGRTLDAQAQEDWLTENRNSLPPIFFERLGWWIPVLGTEASGLIEKLGKK